MPDSVPAFATPANDFEIQKRPSTIALLPFFASGRFPRPDLVGQCRDGKVTYTSGGDLLPRVRDISLGLTALAGTRVERLSAGERQRAGIIRALLGDPPVLLLDEPTASLDSANVRRLLEILLQLRDEGRTLLATTHDPRLVDDPRVNGRLRLVDGVIGS